MEITAVGVDLAKNVFQIHAVNERGKCVLRKRLTRSQFPVFMANLKPCLVAMEACAGANYWARELARLEHQVRLIAPQFVKPFLKSNKNDASDAEAICDALLRPNMRFVSPRSIEQQEVQSLHRVRSRRVAARTALCNEIRGLLLEHGYVLPQGITQIRKNLSSLLEQAEQQGRMTNRGRQLFEAMLQELREIDLRIDEMDQQIQQVHLQSESSRRITEIPGVGPVTATAVLAAVGNLSAFKSGREFSAWVGLVPRQHSSGGKDRLLGISKRGDVYLRTLLIHGARASIRFLNRYPPGPRKAWLEGLIQRRGMNRAIVALANKNARQIWAVLSKKEPYRAA